MANRKVLVIDDELGVKGSIHQRAFLRRYDSLSFEFHFESCSDETAAIEMALGAVDKCANASLILLDIRFGDEENETGFKILPHLREKHPSIPVLIMSSLDRDVKALAKCLENGATGFLKKDLVPDEFERSLLRSIEVSESHGILGSSQPFRELRRQAARLSPYDSVPVLITGERGTGKERVARYIHHNGPRSGGPFVAVNCSAIPDSLLEAELFGSERGAYTGSESLRKGYIERSNRGVLFLDEIGDMPISTQAKLLRVLQDHSFRRVGVTEKEIAVNFQVICATNVSPEVLISEERLREDFYDRIAAVTIHTPPLRDCIEDVPILVEHFLRQMGLDGKKRFTEDAIARLKKAQWPGNVRQLQRSVQEAIVFSEDSEIVYEEHLPERVKSHNKIQNDTPVDFEIEGRLDLQTQRLVAELRIAIAIKQHVQKYKGKQWKAEFMRLAYPECKAQNAKGFQDLIRRLTKGPWGDPNWESNQALAELVRKLRS